MPRLRCCVIAREITLLLFISVIRRLFFINGDGDEEVAPGSYLSYDVLRDPRSEFFIFEFITSCMNVFVKGSRSEICSFNGSDSEARSV